MKNKCFFLIIAILTILSLCSCQEKAVYIDRNKSFYSDFKVDDDVVYIYCDLLIINPFDEEKEITITALFDDDVKNGLLKERKLDGYSKDNKKNSVNLKRGENRLEVVFIGEFAGKNQKHSRNLPEILIDEKAPET